MNLGEWGEIKAVEFLKRKGYLIVETNYRRKTGEIDIIAYDKKTLCFIEVKTRRSVKFGLPCEAVGSKKIRHLIRTAQYYLLENDIWDHDCRIDAFEIIVNGNEYYARHLENAVIL